MLRAKVGIKKIADHLDGFCRSMKQREEWLQWAREKKCKDPSAMATHVVQIAEREAEVRIMSSFISCIREVTERVNEPLTEEEMAELSEKSKRGHQGFPCPTCGANPPRNACPTKCDEYH
jgi:hypothetical protein